MYIKISKLLLWVFQSFIRSLLRSLIFVEPHSQAMWEERKQPGIDCLHMHNHSWKKSKREFSDTNSEMGKILLTFQLNAFFFLP